LTPWRPSDSIPIRKDEVDRWEEEIELDESSGLASYIV
jgi:hypothetical protein